MEQLPNQGAEAPTLPPIIPNGHGAMQMPVSSSSLLSQVDANAVPNLMMPGQAFMPGPIMGGMPNPDASLMMPLVFANGNAGDVPLPAAADKTISADEIALYDRQIRLWGMAAQAKIQSANILLVNMRALGNEVAKNLVLAGVSSLTILDSATVTEPDLGAQFLLAEVEKPVGQNRAEAASHALRKLNPRVQIHVDSEGVKSKGPSYFAGFEVVIATDLDPDLFNLINTATRLNNRSFYAAGTHGMYGFIFSDLIEHSYVIKRDVGNVTTKPMQETRTRAIVDVKTKKEGPKTIESVTKRELYSTWFLASDLAVLPDEYLKSKRRLRSVSPALSCLRALWEFMQTQGGRLPSNREDLKLFTQLATQKHKALSLPSETLRPEFLRNFLQNLGSEIAPTTAILGGQLAQDVINVLGQTQQPIQNMVVFDGTNMEALMYPLHPEGKLGASQLSLGGAADAPIIPNGGGSLIMPPTGLPGVLDSMDMNMGIGMNGAAVSFMNGIPALQALPMGMFPPPSQPLSHDNAQMLHTGALPQHPAPQQLPQQQQEPDNGKGKSADEAS